MGDQLIHFLSASSYMNYWNEPKDYNWVRMSIFDDTIDKNGNYGSVILYLKEN